MERRTVRSRILFALALPLVLTQFACTSGDDPAPERANAKADLVLRNAVVYTADSARRIASAVAIDDGAIVYVGDDVGADAFIGEETSVRDLAGSMVLPGLQDMHIHAFGIIESDGCDLGSTRLSLDAMVPVLRDCLARAELLPGEWLIVQQWAFSRGNEPSADFPTMRAALDAVSTQHPVFLYGDDGHHGAANSAALALAQAADGETRPLDADSLAGVYAEYSTLVEVDALGEPTGGIHEGARLLLRPNWLSDMMGVTGDLDAKLDRVAEVLAARGITSIMDAAVSPEMLHAFARREERGELSFRVRAAMMEPRRAEADAIATHLQELTRLREQYADYQYLRADAVKLFADAVLEGNPLADPPVLPVAAVLGTFRQPVFTGSIEDGSFALAGYVDPDSAACREVRNNPVAYEDREALAAFRSEFGHYPRQCIPSSGELDHEEAFILDYIRAATEAGFHVHVHALSDKAVRVAVDGFARVKATADRLGRSQSLAHLQLVHPDDQERIGELGVAGVFTFAWTRPDPQYELMVVPFLEEIASLDDLYNPDTYYMQNLYPARSMQDAGALIVHGSDAPVDTRDPRPFVNLLQSIYRSDGTVVMNADERLAIADAIDAFTINGARLFGEDNRLGSIEVGKRADLIAIDRNLLELAGSDEIEAIGDTQVLLTVFDGRVIFESALVPRSEASATPSD